MNRPHWVRRPTWTINHVLQQTTPASPSTDNFANPQIARGQGANSVRSDLLPFVKTLSDVASSAAAPLDSPAVSRRPFFRLRVKNGIYFIYGFLPSFDNLKEWLPRLMLQTRSHAFCLHVIGEGPDPSTASEDRIDIPIFTKDKSVSSFCDHLRRCGATECQTYREWQPEYFFGWPSCGGVWALPIPHRTHAVRRAHESGRPDPYAKLELKGLIPRPDELLERLGHALHMDHYCEILEDLGARYYTDPQASVEVRDASLRACRDALEMAEPLNMSVSKYVDGSEPCEIPWLRTELPLQVMEFMMEENLPLYSRDRLILDQLQRKFARRLGRSTRSLDHDGMLVSPNYEYVGLEDIEQTFLPGREDLEDEDLELRLMQLQLAT